MKNRKPYKTSKSFSLTFLLLLIVFSNAHTQNWEEVYAEDFNAALEVNDLSDVSNFIQSDNFVWAKKGATGTNADICARGNLKNNRYLGFELELEQGYEYRMQWNVKTLQEAKELDFLYGLNNSSAAIISGPHVIPLVSANSADGVDVMSDVFSVNQQNDYLLIIKASATNPSTTGASRFDNFRLERRILSTSFSFASASASIIEGNTIEICVTGNNSSENSAQIDVVLPGISFPHLLSFTPQTLTFPANSNGESCFDLNIPLITSDDGNGTINYNFALENPQGGNNLVIEGNTIFTLSVMDVPSQNCEWAGPNVSICHSESVSIGQNWEEEGNECWDNDYCVKWLPDTGIENPMSLQTTVTPTETTTYTVYVTDQNGNLVGSDEVLVEVLEMSTPGITPSMPFICNGSSIELRSYNLGSEDDYTFSWSTGATGTTITVTEAATYTVTATDNANNCAKEASVTVQELNFTASIASDSDDICTGGMATLTAVVEGSEGMYTYVWSTGETTETIIVDNAGTYNLTVNGPVPGCAMESSFTLEEKEIEVTIIGAPFVLAPIIIGGETPETPVLVPLTETQLYCNGVYLLDVEGEFSTIEWSGDVSPNPYNGLPGTMISPPLLDIGGGDGPGNSTPPYTATVMVTDENGCTAEATVTFEEAQNNPQVTQEFFQQKGFYCIDITVLGEVGLTHGEGDSRDATDPCNDIDCPNDESGCVRDEAKLAIAIDGDEIPDLEALTRELLGYFENKYGYNHTRAYITKDDNLCGCTGDDHFLQEIETEFNDNELAFWINISGNIGEAGKLCILANVPTSDIHIPVEEHRKAFLDASLEVAAEDGGTGGFDNEGEQQIFTLIDGSLDNFLSLNIDPGKDRLTEEDSPYLCDGALFDDPTFISPAGYLMQLKGQTTPVRTTLGWLVPEKYRALVPNGALGSFTIWPEDLDPTGRKYFIGRFHMEDLLQQGMVSTNPLLPTRFNGYYAVGSTEIPYETENEPLSTSAVVVGTYDNPGMPQQITVTTGDYLYNTNIANSYPETGEGVLYNSTNFEDPPSIDNYPSPGNPIFAPNAGANNLNYPVIDSPISEAVSFETHNVDGQNEVIFSVIHENGETSWILGKWDTGGDELIPAFRYYIWNCYSGSYDEQHPIELGGIYPEVQMEMQAAIHNKDSNGEQIMPNPPFDFTDENYILENTPELGTEFCFPLSPQQAENLGLGYERQTIGQWPEDLSSNVLNYAQLDNSLVNDFVNEVQRVSNWSGEANAGNQLNIGFILSADDNLVRDPLDVSPTSTYPTTYTQTPGTVFKQEPLQFREGANTNNLPDQLVYVHYRESGSVITCMRLAPDFFTEFTKPDGTVVTIGEAQARLTQAIAFEKWQEGIVALSLNDDFGDDVSDCLATNDCAAPYQQNPGKFGKREGAPALSFINMTGEIGAIAADFAKDGELSDRIWIGKVYDGTSSTSLFELPEVGIGICNAVVAENPAVGFYQLGVFGYSFCTNKQTRKGIWQAFRHPIKTGVALYNDKKDTYTGTDREKRLYAAGYDVTATAFFFLNAATIITKIKGLGKRADGSATKINDEFGLDTSNDIDIDKLTDELSNNNGFEPDDIEELSKYMRDNIGGFANRQKILKNPFLARWWKKFRDDFDGTPCDLLSGFQGGTDTELHSPGGNFIYTIKSLLLLPPGDCPDFDKFINDLPPVPDALYAKLETNFDLDTPEGVQKSKDFVGDTNGNTDFFEEIELRPELVDAWDAFQSSSDDILKALRTDVPTLTRFTDDFGNSTAAINQIKNSPDLLKSWHLDGAVLHRHYAGSNSWPVIQIDDAFKANVRSQYGDDVGDLVDAVDDLNISNNAAVGGGAYHPSLPSPLSNPNTAVNFLSGETVPGGVAEAFINELHPILKKRVDYLEFLKSHTLIDASSQSITNAGKFGSHAEFRVLDKAIKDLEALEVLPGGSFPSSRLDEFTIFVKAKQGTNPPRCVCCWHGTDGVRMIGNE